MCLSNIKSKENGLSLAVISILVQCYSPYTELYLNDLIYFNSVGLSYIDVAVANDMYKKCIEKNFGKLISL